MTSFQHHAVNGEVSLAAVESLLVQISSTPMPRVREAAVRQLYRMGGTLYRVVEALERDLIAGDRILNQKPDADQNEAPETAMWIEWLRQYETGMALLDRILNEIPDLHAEREAA